MFTLLLVIVKQKFSKNSAKIQQKFNKNLTQIDFNHLRCRFELRINIFIFLSYANEIRCRNVALK